MTLNIVVSARHTTARLGKFSWLEGFTPVVYFLGVDQ